MVFLETDPWVDCISRASRRASSWARACPPNYVKHAVLEPWVMTSSMEAEGLIDNLG